MLMTRLKNVLALI